MKALFVICFTVVIVAITVIVANNDLRAYAKNCSIQPNECLPKMIQYAIVERNKLLENKITPEDKCKKQAIGILSTLGKNVTFYNDDSDSYSLEGVGVMVLRKRANVTGSMSTRGFNGDERDLPNGTRVECDMDVQQNHVGWFVIDYTVVARVEYTQNTAIGPWFVNGVSIDNITYNVEDITVTSNNESLTGLLESQIDSIKEDEILSYLNKNMDAESVNEMLPSKFYDSLKLQIAIGVIILCLFVSIATIGK